MSNRYPHKRSTELKVGDFAMTLDEFVRQLGISRERVRQLENRGLAKARAILGKRGYTWEDLLDGERHG